jgi:hypothetical protein
LFPFICPDIGKDQFASSGVFDSRKSFMGRAKSFASICLFAACTELAEPAMADAKTKILTE